MSAFGSGLQICTVGIQLATGLPPLPGGPPAWRYGVNLIGGILYLVAAVLVARRRPPI